jgi:hypothetical protein
MTTSPNQIRGMTLKSVLPASGAMIPVIITSDTSGTNYNYDLGAAFASIGVVGGALVAVNNLSDLTSVVTARSNLGVSASGADTAYSFRANNLSDLANVTTARTNLGVYSTTQVDTAITAAVALISTKTPRLNGLVSGGDAVWESAYTFRVSAASYYINGTAYTSAEQTITLTAAHATLDRIDVIALDTTGTVVKVTGTAAATPSEPDVDPTTQLKLTFVQVAAASSAPAGLTVENIYLENTEWTSSVSGTGIVANGTTTPYAGTKDIEGTNMAAAAYVQLQRSSSTTLDAFTTLSMFIRSKATWTAGRFLRAQFFLNGVAKGTPVTINTGYWGFDSSITSGYQLNAIPVSNFVVPAGTLVNQLRITDVGGAIGFFIDNITMQSTTTAVGGGTGSGITQAQGDARYAQRANNLSDLATPATAATNLGLGTGNSPQFTGINIGHATDTTITRTGAGDIAVEGNAIYRAGGTDVPVADGGTGSSTAAGARTNLDAACRTPQIQTPATNAASITPTFADDQVILTGHSVAIVLNNPTGSALDGWGMSIRIKDNGTARGITYGGQYRAIGVTLPTTTVISKTLYLGMVFNNADTKWDVVAVAQEA